MCFDQDGAFLGLLSKCCTAVDASQHASSTNALELPYGFGFATHLSNYSGRPKTIAAAAVGSSAERRLHRDAGFLGVLRTLWLVKGAPIEVPVVTPMLEVHRPALEALGAGHLVAHSYAPTPESWTLVCFIGVVPRYADRARELLLPLAPGCHAALSQLAGPACEVPAHELSRAQTLVVERVLLGWSNKSIAKDLGKSEATVRNQLHLAFKIVGVRTRAEMIRRLAPHSTPLPRLASPGMSPERN